MFAGSLFARIIAPAAFMILPVTAGAQDEIARQSATDPPNTWTLSGGLGSTKAWNLVGVTKEYLLGANTALFVAAGLGEMILGAGVAFYSNREGNGVVVSAVAGTGVQAALTYEWKLGGTDFLAVGASYIRVFGFSDVHHPQVAPVVSYETRF